MGLVRRLRERSAASDGLAPGRFDILVQGVQIEEDTPRRRIGGNAALSPEREWTFMHPQTPEGKALETGPYVELENGQQVPPVCDWLAVVRDPARDSPLVTVRLEVKDGKPVATLVTVASYPDWEPGLDAEKLGSIQYGDLIEDLVRAQAISAASVIKQGGPPLPNWQGDRSAHLSSDEIDETAEAAAKLHRNRKMNSNHLQKVAEVYSADRTGAPTEAVRAHFKTKHRTATRWVALARERGFLDEYTRPKKENTDSGE